MLGAAHHHHHRQQRLEARSYLERKIRQDALCGGSHHRLAPIVEAEGDGDLALKHLMQAVVANPRHVEARNDLALAIFKRGPREHFGRAVSELKKCLEIDPNCALAHANLSAVYASRGRYQEALRHAKSAARLSPASAMAQRNLARLYDVCGDTRRALDTNARAIQCGPAARRQRRHANAAAARENDDPADAQAYRRVAVLAVGRGETRSRFAHEHYDAYRALTHQTFPLPDSRQTVELLLRANQDVW